MSESSRSRVWGGYPGRVLLVLTFGFMAMQATRLVIPPLVPVVIEDYGISEFVVGVSLSVMWGLYSLLQYVSGRLADELTRKTLLVIGMGLMGFALGTLALSTAYIPFLAGMVLLGLGTGLYPTAAYALLSDLFVDGRGNAIGIYTSGSDIGGVLAAGLATGALAVGVWQTAFLPLMVAAFATAVAIHRLGNESYRLASVSFDVRGTVERLWSQPRLKRILLAYSVYATVWQGFTGFLPAFLQAEKGFSPALASGSFAILFAVGAVTKPTAGWLSDRIPRLKVAFGAVVLGGVALGGILLANARPVVVVALVGFAIGLMAFPPVMHSYLFDVLPNVNVGRDFGSVRTVYLVVGSVGPSITGLLVNQFGYSLAFLALLGELVVTAAILLALIVDRP